MLADRPRDVVAQLERALHRLAAQVEVAVAQAQRLVDRRLLVERERRRLAPPRARRAGRRGPRPRRSAGRGLTVSSERAHDLAARPRSPTRSAARASAACASGAGSGLKTTCTQARAVAQVHEHEAAVVAAAVDPARDAHLVADRAGASAAAPGVAVAGSRAEASLRGRSAGTGEQLPSQAREAGSPPARGAHVAHRGGLALPLLAARRSRPTARPAARPASSGP